jgi:hypothetical protein
LRSTYHSLIERFFFRTEAMFLTRLTLFARLEVLLFLGGLAAIIFFRMLTGAINTRYLLFGSQRDGTRYFSPERVQLLVFTLGTAMFYLMQVMDLMKLAKPGERPVLPDIPAKTLALLGGSHAIYLGGKAYNMLFKKTPEGE